MSSNANYFNSSYNKGLTRAVKRAATICFCLTVLTGACLQPVGANVLSSELAATATQWGNTIAVAAIGERMYSIEKSGALYQTDLTTGKWVQVGKAEFSKTSFLFADAPNLYTIESDGSMYRVSPSSGAWSPVGKPGEWRNTGALVTLNNSLYSIERSGGLFRTDLSTGKWVQLGKAEFGNTKFIFADGQSLYTIEASGSMYRVNPANGAWTGVGAAGAWGNTIVDTTLFGKLFTVERDGGLYETNLATGTWKQIGKAEFGKTQFLFSTDDWLYSIDGGVLYRIHPGSGTWVAVGSKS